MLEIDFQLLSTADKTRKRNEFCGIDMRIKIILWMVGFLIWINLISLKSKGRFSRGK